MAAPSILGAAEVRRIRATMPVRLECASCPLPPARCKRPDHPHLELVPLFRLLA